MKSKHLDWLETTKTSRQCPKCKKFDLDTRIPRGPFVKHFLFWKPYKRYQCSNCNAQVYVLDKI